MSANNQTLIREQNGKFYVFSNVNAEAWSKQPTLSKETAECICDSLEESVNIAVAIEESEKTEYGIVLNRLKKDNSKVRLN